jgi:hypothetical protein
MRTSKGFLGIVCLCLQLGFSGAALAETPYARTCRIAGGQAWTVNFSETNDLTLCRFGTAAIGAPEFAQFKWSQIKSKSIESVLDSAPSEGGGVTCSQFQSQYKIATDLDRRTWGLCMFSDGSAVEVKTLARGTNDPANAFLVEALR